MIIFSKDAESDRRFFRDLLKLPHVDAGEGWLIFALPPAELAVHPAEENGPHELYLLCDDLKTTLKELRKKKIACSAPTEQSWGGNRRDDAARWRKARSLSTEASVSNQHEERSTRNSPGWRMSQMRREGWRGAQRGMSGRSDYLSARLLSGSSRTAQIGLPHNGTIRSVQLQIL